MQYNIANTFLYKINIKSELRYYVALFLYKINIKKCNTNIANTFLYKFNIKKCNTTLQTLFYIKFNINKVCYDIALHFFYIKKKNFISIINKNKFELYITQIWNCIIYNKIWTCVMILYKAFNKIKCILKNLWGLIIIITPLYNHHLEVQPTWWLYRGLTVYIFYLLFFSFFYYYFIYLYF